MRSPARSARKRPQTPENAQPLPSQGPHRLPAAARRGGGKGEAAAARGRSDFVPVEIVRAFFVVSKVGFVHVHRLEV